MLLGAQHVAWLSNFCCCSTPTWWYQETYIISVFVGGTMEGLYQLWSWSIWVAAPTKNFKDFKSTYLCKARVCFLRQSQNYKRWCAKNVKLSLSLTSHVIVKFFPNKLIVLLANENSTNNRNFSTMTWSRFTNQTFFFLQHHHADKPSSKLFTEVWSKTQVSYKHFWGSKSFWNHSCRHLVAFRENPDLRNFFSDFNG